MNQLYVLFTALQLSCAALDIDTICGSGCTEADNASLRHDYAEGICYYQYQQDNIYRQCGVTVYTGTNEYDASEVSCAQTESGKFCTELDTESVYKRRDFSCRYSLTTCTPECQSFLEQLDDDVACCINTFREIYSGSDAKCSIASKCHSIVDPIPTVTEPKTCKIDTSSPFIILDVELLCTVRSDLKQKLINAIYENNCLKWWAFAEYVGCDEKDGEYCFTRANQVAMQNVTRSCSLDTNCTTSCREALILAKEQLGCCANSFVYSKLHPKICQTRKDLWSHCEVESPGFCDNHLQLSGSNIGSRYELVL